jgi:hypothetical protein
MERRKFTREFKLEAVKLISDASVFARGPDAENAQETSTY